MDLVRNASPFWNVIWVERSLVGSRLPRDPAFSIFGAFSLFTHFQKYDKMPKELKYKITEVRWNTSLKGTNKAFITFSNLGYEDLNTNLLKQGSCFIIFAGWWDYWATGSDVKRVFDGLCTRAVWKYGTSGFSVTLELVQVSTMSVRGLYDPLKVGLADAECDNIFKALGRIADYLDVDLALGFGGGDTSQYKAYLEKESTNKREWWLLPDRPHNTNGGTRPRIMADLLDNIVSKTPGCVWNIQDNILYYGLPDPGRQPGATRVAKKFFKYRTGHQELFIDAIQSLHHLEDDTYESIEVDDAASQVGSGIKTPQNKKDKKKPMQVDAKKRVKAWVGERGTWGEATLRPDAILFKEAAGLYVQADRINDAQKEIVKYEMAEARTEEDLNFYSSSRVSTADAVDKAKADSLAFDRPITSLTITGAIGDPLFVAGDVFLFEGLPQHTDEWYAESVTGYIRTGSYYKMDIKGIRQVFSGFSVMTPAQQARYATAQKETARAKIKAWGTGSLDATYRGHQTVALEAGQKYKKKTGN